MPTSPMRQGIASTLLATALSGILAPAAAPGQTRAASTTSPSDAAPLALTPAEYNNTVADLFGFPRDGDRWPARPALADRISPRREPSKGVFVAPPPPPVWPWRFPAEAGSEGFEGIAEGQAPSSYQVEELHLAAMHFASFTLVSPDVFSSATGGPPCPPPNGRPAPGRASSASRAAPTADPSTPASTGGSRRSGGPTRRPPPSTKPSP